MVRRCKRCSTWSHIVLAVLFQCTCLLLEKLITAISVDHLLWILQVSFGRVLGYCVTQQVFIAEYGFSFWEFHISVCSSTLHIKCNLYQFWVWTKYVAEVTYLCKRGPEEMWPCRNTLRLQKLIWRHLVSTNKVSPQPKSATLQWNDFKKKIKKIKSQFCFVFLLRPFWGAMAATSVQQGVWMQSDSAVG